MGKCTDQNWVDKRRQELVENYWQMAENISHPKSQTLTDDEYSKYNKLYNEVRDNYKNKMPIIEISCCPLCNEKLFYDIDVLGLDAPWWSKSFPPGDNPKHKTCKHFRLLTGAIDLHGRDPIESDLHPQREIYPGPGAPFVIPTILENPGMIAVISSFKSPQGDTYYAIAYFSPDWVHASQLYQPWARQATKVYDRDGNYEGWTILNHPWDFDLQPYIEKKQLVWIPPDEEKIVNSGTCPYVNLKGIQKPQIIKNGKVTTTKLPDGSAINPFSD